MHRIFFIQSSVNGHLGCFRVLAIVNSAAMNIRVHFLNYGFLQIHAQERSYGNSRFSFLRTLHTVFHHSGIAYDKANNENREAIKSMTDALNRLTDKLDNLK